MHQRFQWDQMTMGTCYYPEHWPKSMWRSDLERMLHCGISCIRIAEFAWNLVETEEGVFCFDFFQEFLDLCAEMRMRVILGTPTATPPAWLTEKYPEVLNCRRDGIPYRHGCRRHYNYNSIVYQHFCSRIVERMAEQYAGHSAVVGWQIDNELNCETDVFYSEADTMAFREYLKAKFETLENLNESLGMVFWNQSYSNWDQLYVPRLTLDGTINPHLHLEYIRFVSESANRFCRMQADIIRKFLKPGDFVTTNGMFGSLDNHKMTREALDVYTYDSYPNFAHLLAAGGGGNKGEVNLGSRAWSKNLANVRSVCPHFGIMEQQSGANGWTTRMEAPAPRPGQLALWAMQSVAHGADYVSFFRWRTARMGTEIYWHGILDYDARDNRKLAEVRDFYNRLSKLQPVCGADFAASFTLINDYGNEWDCKVDAWHSRINAPSMNGIFAASQFCHTPYNVVFIDQPDAEQALARCPVAFYPHPMIAKPECVSILRRFVENGGTLILGCRSGLKDAYGRCPMTPQPGLFAELTGSDVREFTFCSPAEDAVYADFNGTRLPAPVFNDVLTPLGEARVLARYTDSFYKGEAALVENVIGSGRVLHWGSVFDQATVKALFAYCGILEPFSQIVDAPRELELVVRENDGKRWLFALNYEAKPVTMHLKRESRMLYDGHTALGAYTLPPFGTAVFEL